MKWEILPNCGFPLTETIPTCQVYDRGDIILTLWKAAYIMCDIFCWRNVYLVWGIQ